MDTFFGVFLSCIFVHLLFISVESARDFFMGSIFGSMLKIAFCRLKSRFLGVALNCSANIVCGE